MVQHEVDPGPDDSLRRSDMAVTRVSSAIDDEVALLWVECKSDIGNARQVELQVLELCNRNMPRTGGIAGRVVWAMTTIGLTFRLWKFDKITRSLAPLHGQPEVTATRSEYIDAKHPDAVVFFHVVQQIKNHTASMLTEAISTSASHPASHSGDTPGVSSLPSAEPQIGYEGTMMHDDADDMTWDQFTESQTQFDLTDYDLGSGQAVIDMGEASGQAGEAHTAIPSASNTRPHEAATGPGHGPSGREDTDTSSGRMPVDPVSGNSDNIQAYVEFVTVRKVSHMLSPDEYFFRCANRKSRSTRREQWKEGVFNGKRVWVYNDKGSSYISKEKIR
ncbi:uncharacterized protein SPSK_00050 [Sporothrix schenckii 1099-18]|uniref:Uncharacterized protein n=1 Tax=Sporothrix schenckii 1099-18 TaxID=1397361 RepID=A0A0F2LSG8_SPOSC|nr:uncharacterized protein SPSK_00050 [Sporothrix schenckii 1099-18]KJR79824.1 hypothetical protein SPSK_00050 [Sporothrix schenckii 1099-18]